MVNSASSRSPISSLSSLLSEPALDLLEATGASLIETIGIDVIRNVVLDVLTGRNIRSSTESLTRRRIALLNVALLDMFFKGTKLDPSFVENFPYIAADSLSSPNPKAEEWLSNWALGLTGKGVQNVLRDDRDLIPEYRDIYIETCEEVIGQSRDQYGDLTGTMRLASGPAIEVNWLFLLYLLNTVGSETLTIRGSEKSLYGKFFEKLVLGSLLYILDFEYVPSGDLSKLADVFWLSSDTDQGRESDATILYRPGRGVRMDIGFIGRGNSEISLDKVSRYRREIELGSQHWYMGTIIVVDRIGRKSRLPQLAEDIEGTVVQMSAGYWPKRIAITLGQILDYDHDLVGMEPDHVKDYLEERIRDVPLEQFIRSASKEQENTEG